MRPTHNATWVDQDGVFLGVNLGADFCAEHEWGIKRLKGKLGMDKNEGKIGIAKREVTYVNENDLHFTTKGKYGILLYDNHISWYHNRPEDLKGFLDRALPKYHIKKDEDGIVGAWDEGSFGIRVAGSENKKNLQELHKAIMEKDVIVFLGKFSQNPFENSGLLILIKSKLPKEFVDAAREADEDAIRLKKASEATGIHSKLEKAGKRYIALSPRWIAEARKTKSKHPVQYWLNPFDQQNNEYGWYTVEELELWAEDKGPVIENSETFKEGRHSIQR